MRVNIFKRLESSVNSFSLTIERILNKVNHMLILISTENEYSLDDSLEDYDLDDEIEVGGKTKINK